MSYFDEVYKIVMQIPEGSVATYGMVAAATGNPRASRAVGWALHVNPEEGVIPCHRVVMKDGGLSKAFAFGGTEEHQRRLEAEGVGFINGKVDMKKYLLKI